MSRGSNEITTMKGFLEDFSDEPFDADIECKELDEDIEEKGLAAHMAGRTAVAAGLGAGAGAGVGYAYAPKGKEKEATKRGAIYGAIGGPLLLGPVGGAIGGGLAARRERKDLEAAKNKRMKAQLRKLQAEKVATKTKGFGITGDDLNKAFE